MFFIIVTVIVWSHIKRRLLFKLYLHSFKREIVYLLATLILLKLLECR